MKSVQSINPFKSVIQTNYDIEKTHSDKIKIQTNQNEATTFTIVLPA